MMPILESIVHKGMTVSEFKVQLIAEAYKQGVDQKLTVDRWVWSVYSCHSSVLYIQVSTS